MTVLVRPRQMADVVLGAVARVIGEPSARGQQHRADQRRPHDCVLSPRQTPGQQQQDDRQAHDRNVVDQDVQMGRSDVGHGISGLESSDWKSSVVSRDDRPVELLREPRDKFLTTQDVRFTIPCTSAIASTSGPGSNRTGSVAGSPVSLRGRVTGRTRRCLVHVEGIERNADHAWSDGPRCRSTRTVARIPTAAES